MAFNGQRQGFILGGGIGAGNLHYSEAGYSFNRGAFATDFKIGYAPSNSLEIYYINSVSWFSYNSLSYAMGTTGLGVTKYLNPEGKGFFIFGGGGLSFFQNLSYTTGHTGFGFLAGIGYDIAKHWSIQGDVVYTDIESGAAKSTAFRVTLNVLAF
jgi:hypothetical protein